MLPSEMYAWSCFQVDCQEIRQWQHVTADQRIEVCDRCNYDKHECPGCGEPLPHQLLVCEECRKL